MVAEAVERERVVSMLRGSDRERMLETAHAVLAGGLRLIMVTMTIPDAPRLLETLVSSGADAIFGAGSVTTIGEAVEMIEAGAAFVASPLIDKRIIDYCRDNGVYVAAGGLTPTEVMKANLAGADLVKVYPVAAVGGADYIRFLLRPMPFPQADAGRRPRSRGRCRLHRRGLRRHRRFRFTPRSRGIGNHQHGYRPREGRGVRLRRARRGQLKTRHIFK